MANFFKTVLATILGLLIFLGVGVGAIVMLIVWAAKDTLPEIRKNSILVFDMSIGIRDTVPELEPEELLSRSLTGRDINRNLISLRNAVTAIEQAATDSRISALYLRGSSNPRLGGFANMREVRQALLKFRASGKKVIAYDVDWSEREYYLASMADQVLMNPIGTLEMNGFESEMMFLAGAMQKYGIDVQVARAGQYKSAVEPFLLTKSSPQEREQTQKLLGGLWIDYVGAVASGRQLKATQVQAIANGQGFLLAGNAIENKLVDQLASIDQVSQELKVITGSNPKGRSFPQISLRNYVKVLQSEREVTATTRRNRIALLYAEGEIISGRGMDGAVGGDSFSAQLRRLRQDNTVKAIVLRINSPGGSVTASELIQQEVILTRREKPVIVSMGNVAASGGYWIATYGDRIYAEPTTITGSIGVFGLLPNIQKLANTQGITWDTIKTARYADLDTIARAKTPQEMAFYQKMVDWTYEQFLKRVAESRKLSPEKVAAIAQGRVWSGSDAKQIGLVDEIGGLDAAIQEAVKRANLGTAWQVDEYPRRQDFRNRLLEQIAIWGQPAVEESPIVPDPLTTQIQQVQQDLKVLRFFNDPRNLYVRLPFTLQIK